MEDWTKEYIKKYPGMSSLTRREREQALASMGIFPDVTETGQTVEEIKLEVVEKVSKRKEIRGKPYKLFGWG